MKQMAGNVGKQRDAQPPSGGCVLKLDMVMRTDQIADPAAFGRLCVETRRKSGDAGFGRPSRLRAAVC